MRVLVAGGAGFLGSHLVRAHLDDGDEVVIIDDLSTGHVRNIPPEFPHEAGKLVFLHEDAADIFDALSTAPGGVLHRPFDIVYHLASPASPKAYREDPMAALLAGSAVTHALLSFAVSGHPKARFVFASTSEVYGDPLVSPQPEDYRGNVSSIGPRSMYDEAKRYGEAVCACYAREGYDVRIARIFNTYGPRMDLDDGRLVPTLIRQALADEPFTIEGTGRQTRSLCFVDDLIRGLRLLAMADLPRSNEPVVVNLGNDQELTVLRIVERVHEIAFPLEETVPKVRLKFLPAAPDDPKQRRPDLTRARELLGYTPRVEISDGLRETFEWFRTFRDSFLNAPF